MTDETEVVGAELVEDGLLPALAEAEPVGRPLVDRHTMLRPGQAVPTTADAPIYTEADFRISAATAELQDQAPPQNTSRQYRSPHAGSSPPGARSRAASPCRAPPRRSPSTSGT